MEQRHRAWLYGATASHNLLHLGPSLQRETWERNSISTCALFCAAEGDDPEPPVAPPEQFSDDDLDALALLFAAVKILYLGGAVSRAQTLVAAIEPTRRAAAKPLHETTIRNEHAYYCCVAQILAVDPRSAPPAYPAAASPPEAGAAPPVVDVYVGGRPPSAFAASPAFGD